MSGFAVIRHTGTGGVGTTPAEALDHHRANGWARVSDWRAEPSAFHLPDFADATGDLDAPEHPPPEPEPEPTTEPGPEPARTTRRSKA